MLSVFGCSPERSGPAADPDVRRDARFGVLTDLVLFDRPPHEGGPFWLDRFETTNQDWLAYQRALIAEDPSVAGALPGPDLSTLGRARLHLPVAWISFDEARAYARWRLGRLPRFGEWKWAANGGGYDLYDYPWGDQNNVTWANTGDLQLHALTPVGSFESGRQQLGGDAGAAGGPYDLIGNVGEWTTTPSMATGSRSEMPRWLIDGYARRLDALRSPALACWLPSHVPLPPPTSLLLAVDPRRTYRTVCGHVHLSMKERSQVWGRAPTTAGSWTGMRFATDPETLLLRLLRAGVPEPDADRQALLAFVRVPRHRALLESAWRTLARSPFDGERVRGATWLRSLIDGGRLP